MADTPKPGRAKPVLERFEISETGLPAQLTEEQKTWRVVKLRPASERFEVLKPQPTLRHDIEDGGADLIIAANEALIVRGAGRLAIEFTHSGSGECEAVSLRPVEGWNPAVVEQVLAVVRQALDAARPSEVPFEETSEDGSKPVINTTRILQRAEQDLQASEKLVEDRARVATQPDAEARIRQWIAAADAKIIAAVQKLLALGARPEVVAEVMAGMLAEK